MRVKSSTKSKPSNTTFDRIAATPPPSSAMSSSKPAGSSGKRARESDESTGANTATPTTATGDEALKKKRRKARKKEKELAAAAAKDSSDEFSNLFMMDLTPSAVPKDVAFIDSAVLISPTKAPIVEKVVEEITVELTGQAKEDEEMRLFAQEVAMDSQLEDDDEEVEDDDEEEEDDDEAVLYDDPKTLEKAIQGKIVDDSAAKVTGRYYKEVDLTRNCSLCGEQGHSSRECTHSQCFTCGVVDGDHEARNCPVSLICSACGSRGHFSRDCHDSTAGRSAFGSRCATCSSSNHGTANCSTLWRVYDTTGAKPTKAKIIFACSNEGVTSDHFADDCLLPRMHPLRHVDSSAFNRMALPADSRPAASTSRRSHGSYGASGPTGSEAAARRRGGGGEKREQQAEDDDDWFASRGRGNGGGGNGRAPPSGPSSLVKRISGTGSKRDRYANETTPSSYVGGGRYGRQNQANRSGGGSDTKPRGPKSGGKGSAGGGAGKDFERNLPPHLREAGGSASSSSSSHKIKFSGGDNQDRFKGSPMPRERERDSGDRGGGSARDGDSGRSNSKRSNGGGRSGGSRRDEKRDDGRNRNGGGGGGNSRDGPKYSRGYY